jgi:hypothetical protein
VTGTGLGAEYTVTLLPPPCGMSAIDMIFTPMVAQSSDEASLTITARFAVCVAVEVVVLAAEPPEELPDPPPQAARSMAALQSDSARVELDIIHALPELTIRFRCRDIF